MSQPSPANKDTLSLLESSLPLLNERNEALADLARASSEMLSILREDPAADIGAILERREKQCRKYAEVCSRQLTTDDAALGHAETAARSGQQENAKLGMSILSLHADAQGLAELVVAAQSECETILRNRLRITARALQASSKRRKLDAAYGPACRHNVPVFLDRHR